MERVGGGYPSVAPCRTGRSLIDRAELAPAPGRVSGGGEIESDQQGSLRLIKNSRHNCGRDDVVVAWALAAGARARIRPRRGGLIRSLIA